MAVRKRMPRVINTKVSRDKSFCRMCETIKSEKYFFDATDKILDKNGHMSVCKDCINELYNQFYKSTGSVEHAILKLCQLLNVKFDQSAINSALVHAETLNSNGEKMFGMYKAKLFLMNKINGKMDVADLAYNYPVAITINAPKEVEENIPEDIDVLHAFWGENFSASEIDILERKFSDWSRSHAIDTQSERVLLKYICLKEFEIDNAISLKQSTASLMKEFQELLKTSALSPSMANAASGGKSMEAFGNWVKEIENMTPAEWMKDKSIYKDVDNIEEYGEKYITSPLRSFVTGSREFSLEDDSEKDDSDSVLEE